ncbi:MAG TPA: nucleoside-diphosphate sugar epimerase [Flavobacteriales bacterium]|jgi:dihydroflavonol-4-reductase|nr:nucleoside-diphosphate sugar epimerase [Flavobacteriales bacterium]
MDNRGVLVTGGTGIVGARLLFDLASRGERVYALKRPQSDIQTVSNVFRFLQDDGQLFERIEWLEGDITEYFSLEDAFQYAKSVIHAAALVSFNRKDRTRIFKVNVKGTENVVNACLKSGVEVLGYVSSTAALGVKKEGDIDEETKWNTDRGASYYSISKHYAEREVWRGHSEGLDIAVVNPCIVVGPGNWNRSSGTLFKKVKEGLNYYTEGSNAFVAVEDVSAILLELLDRKVYGQRYLTIGENMSYKDFLQLVASEMKVNGAKKKAGKNLLKLAWLAESLRSTIMNDESRLTLDSLKSAVLKRSYSNQKITEELGFSFTPIVEAVERTAKYYRD